MQVFDRVRSAASKRHDVVDGQGLGAVALPV
jgi:hypothetical protein